MENLHHHIEAYLLGELPELGKTAFEQAMQQDAELARATEAHREVMKRLEGMRLRQAVQAAVQEPRDQSSGFRLGPWWWRLLLFAGGVGALVFMLTPEQSKTELPLPATENIPSAPIAIETPDTSTPLSVPVQNSPTISIRPWAALAQKYQVKPTPTALRSTNPSSPAEKTALVSAQEAYHQGRYQETLLLLEEAPAGEDVRYYRANALFRLLRFKEAGTEFKSLETSFQYQHEARWNHFLCKLAGGELHPAKARKEALKMASDETFELHEFAAGLAEELKEK